MADAEARVEAAKKKYMGKVVKGTRSDRSVVGLVIRVYVDFFDESEIFLKLLRPDGVTEVNISLSMRVVTIAGEDE